MTNVHEALNIDESRKFLLKICNENFKDKTFGEYIDRGLAGDFACEIANYIKAALTDIEKCEPVGVVEEVAISHDGRHIFNATGEVNVGDKLFTSPQPREWVGVDDAISVIELYAPNHEIIAKLKQLNSNV